MERIKKGIETSCAELLQLLPRCSDKAAALGVSIDDLKALATGRPLPPTILDVFLRFIARQAGAGFLDDTGLQATISDPLEVATPPAWQGPQKARRVTVVSAPIGQQLLGKGTLSDPAKAGLATLKPAHSLAIVKPRDGSGPAVDGVWVTLTVVPKTVQVKHLTGTKRRIDALDRALTAAKLKNGRFSHQTGAGETDDWHVLAKVVTHVFGATGGQANPETLPNLLHCFLIGLIKEVCAGQDPEENGENGAESSTIAGDEGDGGGGGEEGGDKGSKGGGGGGGVGGGGVGGGGDD